MSVPDKVSYFSRFTVKFVEICAASIATAVGGYLVAHLGGYLPWSAQSPPVPAAIQTAPNVSVVPKGPRAQPAPPDRPFPPTPMSIALRLAGCRSAPHPAGAGDCESDPGGAAA